MIGAVSLIDFPPPGSDPRSAAAVNRLLKSDWEIHHSLQVRKISLALFDLLKPLHQLGPDDRDALEFAALLHDIGFEISESRHHKHSYSLILSDLPRPLFSGSEILKIALTARYHRKAVPDREHEGFDGLAPGEKRAVTLLGGILRVADGLDRSHGESVREIQADYNERQVIIRVGGVGLLSADIAGGRRKCDLFNLAFQRALLIEDMAADDGETAADQAPECVVFISDIHANLPGLMAALDHIDAKGFKRIYCLGDFIGFGPHPNEVIEVIKQREIPAIIGNFDREILELDPDAKVPESWKQIKRDKMISRLWTKKILAPENQEFLRSLPQSIQFRWGGYDFLLVHGSPRDVNEHIYPELTDEELGEILHGVEADVVVCGHVHLPFVRTLDKIMVVGAGTVGKPVHGKPEASYVVVELADGELQTGIEYLKYDTGAVIKCLVENKLPAAFIRMFREGVK